MAKAVISTPLNGSPVTEGNPAVITYHLSVPLSSATTVSASVGGTGITAGDYSDFQYRMGNASEPLWMAWKPVLAGGVITLNAGFSDFQLKVTVLDEGVVEKWDALTFVVAQTAQTIGIESSWYVASTVALRDVDASYADATITLASTSPHTATEAAELGVTGTASDSNHAAYALYDVSVAGNGGLSAATTLNAAVYGEGATAGSDYRYLQYRASTSVSPDHAVSGNWTSWTPVTSGQISLGVGTKHFELSTSVPTDNVVETWESLTFTVGQTAASSHIENSWYVGSRVALLDAGSTLPNATITLASASPLTATEATDPSNHAAYARYDVSLPGGLSVATSLNAAVYGVGATAGLDYGTLQYRALTGSTWSGWSSVSVGQISLTAGVKQFELSTSVLSDTVEETWESLIFAVSQTSASSHIENSWYVASNVALLDADGALAVTVTDDVPGVVNIAHTSVVYTYTFNRPVTGLTSDDFAVTYGAIQSITPSDTPLTPAFNTTYTVNVLSADVASGNISLVLRQGAVFDADGNTNLISTEASQAIDRLAPAPAGSVITFSGNSDPTVNLAEANAGFALSGTNAPDATVTLLGGQAATALDSTHWRVTLSSGTISGYGQGDEVLTVVSTDAAGNPTSFPDVTLNVDTVPPVHVALLTYSGSDNIINAAELVAPFFFRIAGTNEDGATVTLDGQPVAVDSPTTWHVLLNQTTINGYGQGGQALTVVSTDAAGNTTTDTVNLTVDTEVPAAAGAIAFSGDGNSTINAAEAAAFTISGSKASDATVSLSGQSVVVDNSTTWHVDLSPGTITGYGQDGETLTVVSTDAAGNAANTTVNLTVDTVAPAAAVVNPALDLTINAAEAAGFTISGTNESGAVVTLADQSVVADTATTWHVDLSAATILTYAEGAKALTVVSTDAAGNATNATVNLSIDRVAPTVTINIVDNSLGDADNSSVVNFTFSEAPGSSFVEGDITAVNGAISNLVQVTPTTYSATFTADDSFSGNGSVTVDASKFTDAAGNASAVAGSDTVAINTLGTLRYVTVSGTPDGVTNFNSIQAAIDASSDNDTTLVAAGNYTESARYKGSGIADNVGLSINKSVNIIGLDASGQPVTSVANIAVHVTAAQQSDWGTNFMVTAPNVSISGIDFIAAGDTKTFEVVADNFTLKDSKAGVNVFGDPVESAVYFNDEIVPPGTGTNWTSAIQTYSITENSLLADVTISSGTGLGGVTGPTVIQDNTFVVTDDWSWGIGLRGYDASVAWCNASVEAPSQVTGNTFTSGGAWPRYLSGSDNLLSANALTLSLVESFIANNTLPQYAYVTNSSGNSLTYRNFAPADVSSHAVPNYAELSGSLFNADYLANAGDRIVVFSGTATDNETITKNNLTVQAQPGSVDLNLTLDTAVTNLTLSGVAAVDVTGNALANTIIGNSGNNVITGGAGGDTLTGGGGNDTFVFTAGSSIAVAGSFDTIMDLSSGDKINQPSGIVASRVVLDGGTFASESAWIASLTPNYSSPDALHPFVAGELLVYRSGSDAYLWINTDGNDQFNVATDTFIKLVGADSMLNVDLAAFLI